jgi:hypothetical protein
MMAVDWCCGYGGMTAGMQAAGFDVVGVDLEPARRYPAPCIQGDVRHMDGTEAPPAVWDHFSPPCNRFSSARANRKDDPPTEADLDILEACLRIRDARGTRFWSIENVRGAVPWFRPLLGEPVLRHGPFFFWGNFPPFLVAKDRIGKGLCGGSNSGRQWHKSRDPRVRAMVPAAIAEPLARAIAVEVRPPAIVDNGSGGAEPC